MKGLIQLLKFSGILFILMTPAVVAQVLQNQPILQPVNRKPIPDTIITINNQTRNGFIEIDRLVVDETLSKAGYEFLELFQAKWIWPPESNEPFQIVVTERPFRGITTLVVITLNDLIVFESFLQTRYDVLESMADAAVEQTFAYLINYENIMKQLAGEDLASDGMF